MLLFEISGVNGSDGEQRIVGVRSAGEAVGVRNPKTAAGQLDVRVLRHAADINDRHEFVASNPGVTLVVLDAFQEVCGQVLSEPLAVRRHVLATLQLIHKCRRDQLLYSISVETYLSLTQA